LSVLGIVKKDQRWGTLFSNTWKNVDATIVSFQHIFGAFFTSPYAGVLHGLKSDHTWSAQWLGRLM